MSTQSLIPYDVTQADWSTNEPKTIIPKIDILAAILINFTKLQATFKEAQELSTGKERESEFETKKTYDQAFSAYKPYEGKTPYRSYADYVSRVHVITHEVAMMQQAAYKAKAAYEESTSAFLQAKAAYEQSIRNFFNQPIYKGLHQTMEAFRSVFTIKKDAPVTVYEERPAPSFNCELHTRWSAATIRVAVTRIMRTDVPMNNQEFEAETAKAFDDLNKEFAKQPTPAQQIAYEERLIQNTKFMCKGMHGLLAAIKTAQAITDPDEKRGARRALGGLGIQPAQAASLLLQADKITEAINAFEEATIETITTY